MSENYLNYKLDGSPIGLRKGDYLEDQGEFLCIWDPRSGYIDRKDPLNQNVRPPQKLEDIPEGKFLVVVAMNGGFDAALCFADPWDFHHHWETSDEWRMQNDPRPYLYFLLDQDKAKLMYNGGSGRDWDYMEKRKESA